MAAKKIERKYICKFTSRYGKAFNPVVGLEKLDKIKIRRAK